MIKCITFDFDGTLVNSNSIKEKTFYSVTNLIPESTKILSQILGNTKFKNRNEIFLELSQKLNKCYSIKIDPNYFIKRYTIECEKLIINASEITGTKLTLNKLSKTDYTLAISSATPKKTLNNILNKRGLSKYFKHIFGAPFSKEEHLKRLFALTSCKPRELLLVGDSEIDLKSAQNVGSHFIGIGKNFDRFSSKPKYFLKDLRQLCDFLKILDKNIYTA